MTSAKVDIIDEVIAVLKEGNSFCLSGHQNPDADVVGSELALASLIRRLGPQKRVDILNSGKPPHSIAFLPGIDSVKSVAQVDGVYDVVVVHECSGGERMGGIIDLKNQAKKVINMDHHLHNPNFGDVNFVEPTTSSTCELVFKIFERMGIKPDRDEATCLYTGLVADTGWFRYGNTNAQTHRIAGELVAAGVAVADLGERMYMSKSLAGMKLRAHALSTMRLFYDNRVALITIPESIFTSVGASPDDTEAIVNLGLEMESVVVSVLLKEKKTPPSEIKVSLRSKGDWDINQVARHFGGGGHKNASGCRVTLPLDQAEKAFIEQVGASFPDFNG